MGLGDRNQAQSIDQSYHVPCIGVRKEHNDEHHNIPSVNVSKDDSGGDASCEDEREDLIRVYLVPKEGLSSDQKSQSVQDEINQLGDVEELSDSYVVILVYLSELEKNQKDYSLHGRK